MGDYQEQTIEIDGLKVNYKRAGQGTPFIILHGWGRGSDSWAEALEKLAGKGYQAIAPDLPGFGKSQPPSAVWGVEDYTQLVKKFADSIGAQSFILLGGSFGGQVAVQFVSSYPERVQKLILSAAAVVRRRPAPKRKAFMIVSRLIHGIFSVWPLSVLHPLLQKIAYKILGNQDYLYTKGIMKEVREKVIRQDLAHVLPKIACPTLILWGDKDAITPIEDASIIERGIPHSSVRIFKGVGHSIHREAPEEFIEAITQFLQA
ncbi:MAG: alpha/beta hydrolase [bacterium]|nr:alpha/beta hydrolase [bacterium]